MPVYLLGDELSFPPVDGAEDGLVAVGGDLSPQRLLLAYRSGIFPWYEEGQPILWHSPDPRWVITPQSFHVSRRLRRQLRNDEFEVSCDRAFADVVRRCSAVPRPGQDGTWIHDEMVEGYQRLFELGAAHSVEVWKGERLVGGLYGLAIGGVFCGESMFSEVDDASKVGFVTLAERLFLNQFEIIDCQVQTAHLERFGARPLPRSEFVEALVRLAPKRPSEQLWAW